MADMTREEIEALLARVPEGYTLGPWGRWMEDLRGGRFYVVVRPGGADCETIDIHEDDNGSADTALIALAPEAIAMLRDLLPVIRGMEEALRPFAEFPAAKDDRLPPDMPMTRGSGLAVRQVTVADFRRARTALTGGQNG